MAGLDEVACERPCEQHGGGLAARRSFRAESGRARLDGPLTAREIESGGDCGDFDAATHDTWLPEFPVKCRSWGKWSHFRLGVKKS